MNPSYKIITPFLLALGLGLCCFAHSKTSGNSDHLRISANITGYCYYKGSPESTILLIKIRINYLNTGKQSIILDKAMSIISSYQISNSIEELKSKQYTADVHVHYGMLSNDLNKEAVTPSDRFVIIKPNEFYESNSEILLFLNDKFKAGNYVMRAVIPNWFESDKQTRRLEKNWKKIGRLQKEYLIIEPLLFQIENNPEIRKDSAECKQSDI